MSGEEWREKHTEALTQLVLGRWLYVYKNRAAGGTGQK